MKRLLSSVFLMLCVSWAFPAAAQIIKGKVIDQDGESLPGASVVVLGQEGVGTATDFDGNFTLKGFNPGTVKLRISFIGYAAKNKTVKVKQGETKEITITLEPADDRLDEVVIVGYGVQRKRDVTGNIVSLEGKEVRDMPAPSFEAALQGKAPGVQIATSGGMAGSNSVVRIRGIASVGGGGDPLYIVDGVQIDQDYFRGSGLGRGDAGGMNQNPLAFLNPDDIESVEILKDAAATAIYGSRGANGVILITTRRGSSSKLNYSFSTTQGVSMPTNRPEMLSTREWLDLYEEAWINDGNVGKPTGLPAQISWDEADKYNTNWVDEVIRTGYKQFYDFGIDKVTERFNFYAGLSYDANQSYLKGDQYDRLSGRFNGDYRFNDKFSAGLSTNLVQGTYFRVDNGPAGGLGAAMSSALPIFPVRYDQDVYLPDPENPGDSILTHRKGDYWFEAGANNNPTGLRNLKQWRSTELRSINNVRLTYEATKNLSFNANASFDYSNLREDLYEPVGGNSYINADPNLGQGIAKRYPRQSFNYNTHFTANYLYDLDENHHFNFMVGTEYVNQRSEVSQWLRPINDSTVQATNEVFNARGPFFDDDALRDTVAFDSVRTESERIFASYFGRINYNYKRKYLAQLVLRADGSSSFGPDNVYGFFPSLGLGWVISDESWLKHSSVINYLKLRGSMGYIGNANIQQNQFEALYQVNNAGYNNQPIRYPINPPNRNLKWENTEVVDVALEFGLFEDRITGELAYYRKNTRDVLMQVSLPRINGFDTYYDNVGQILNYGVEFQLSTHNLTGKFRWKTDFNIAFNRNRILSLGGYSEDAVAGGTNDTRIVEGASLGTFYMVEVARVDPATGDPVYRSPSGEETKVYDQANRVPVGNGIPDAIGGLTNTFTYENWTLSTMFVFSIGADVYDHSGKYQQTGWAVFGNYWNYTPAVYDRWTEPGDQARLPRLTLDRNSYEGLDEDFWNTSLWVSDASYLRLRNVTIGYRVKKDFAKKLGLKSLEVSAIGTNLLTFTNFRGLDPEVARDFTNVTDRNMSLNTTYLTAPQEKTYSIRLSANF